MFLKNTLSSESVNSLNTKSKFQQVMYEKKQLLSEEVKSFDCDFDHLNSDLSKLKNKTINYLNGISQLEGNTEFNKEFAKSRSIVCNLQDLLSSFGALLSDNSMTNLLPDDSITEEEIIQKKSTEGNPFDEAQSLTNSTSILAQNKAISQFSTFKERPFTTPGPIEGIVSHAVSPWMFYFQSLSRRPQLEIMQEDLKYFMKQRNVKNRQCLYRESDLVAAKFSSDGVWYRARIVSIIETVDEAEYEVFFMDYGNSETLPYSSLCELPVELLHAPGLAICCSLNNVSPPNERCTWSDESTKMFDRFLSEHQFYESSTIRPYSTVENGLIFVELSQKNDKPIRDCKHPLDITRELEQSGCLQIVKSNKNAINWFEYFCNSEDENRRFRSDKFADRIWMFNNCDILKPAVPSSETRKNSLSRSARETSPASSYASKSGQSKSVQGKQNFKSFEMKPTNSNNCSYSAKVKNDKPHRNGTQVSNIYKSNQKDSRASGMDYIDSRTLSRTDSYYQHSDVIHNESNREHSSKQFFNPKTSSTGSIKMAENSLKLELKEANQPNKSRNNPSFNYKPLLICDTAFEIQISHIESPSLFWAIIGDFGLEQFAKLNKEIDEHLEFCDKNQSLKPCNFIEVGAVCLVVLEDDFDGGMEKHRAKITKVYRDERKIEALLVDNGKKVILSSDKNIFELPSSLIERYPAMAVPCKLEGIEPKGFAWSDEALTFFRDEVYSSSNLIAYYGVKYHVNDLVYGYDNDPVEIDLRITRDGHDESYITLLSNYDFAKLSVKNDVSKTLHHYSGTGDGKVSNGFERFQKGNVRERFTSENNNYVDSREGYRNVVGNYEGGNRRLTCKFFNRPGGCRHGDKCRFAHTLDHDASPTTDASFVTCVSSAEMELRLPDVGTSSLVIVSAFVNPQSFCINLSFEACQTTSGEMISPPLDELVKSMNRHYNLSLPDRGLDSFADGEIVAARSQEFELWLRAMITSTENDDNCEVFFVDYGNIEILPPYRIRTMSSQFMKLPFQAIKSSLPISPSHGVVDWTQDAIDCFKSLVKGRKLKASILQSLPCGSLLMDLFLDDGGVERNIGNIMIERGHAVCSFLKYTCGSN